MSHNTFGHLFRVTTWGESHGPALGCVVDGCPPGLQLTEAEVQHWLDRRRPGSSRFVTQRREPDQVRILSGVFSDEQTDGQVTTGTPISMMIDNVDARSRDYSDIARAFRPGHADYPYFAKYGVRDYRGGGRSSARETAARVAAGAVARKVLGDGVRIRAALVQIGPHKLEPGAWDWAETENNPFWCPDAKTAAQWEAFLDGVRKDLSSVGAVAEVHAEGVPPVWARWRRKASASTHAVMASSTGAARMATQGSWRPVVLRSISVPDSSMDWRGVGIEEVGLNATRATMVWPVEMPPRIPPAWFDRNRTPSSPMRISSALDWPVRAAEAKPSPISTPLAALIDMSAAASSASSLP